VRYSQEHIQEYYAELVNIVGREEDLAVVAVAHMVSNSVTFLPALDQLAELACILPKPKSLKQAPQWITDQLRDQFRMEDLSREWAADPRKVLNLLSDLNLGSKQIILVDIGGYFADSLKFISRHLNGKLVGILEGTENGVQKYEEVVDGSPAVPPVITVARSPLKLPEDYLVASSVVFSIEAILREKGSILQGLQSCVIGYGRVGSSVAEILRNRGLPTSVYDIDPIQLAKAAVKGFSVHTDIDDAVRKKSLIVCATGGTSIDAESIKFVEDGCILASVTSGDDEFDLAGIREIYRVENLDDLTNTNTHRYIDDTTGRNFLMLDEGNAVNFAHGAVIGQAMQLIEGEKVAAIKALIHHDFEPTITPGLYELGRETRTKVATVWNRHFL